MGFPLHHRFPQWNPKKPRVLPRHLECSNRGVSLATKVSLKRPRAFDPLDLEIIDRVYEAASAQIEAREPHRDTERDGERQQVLRKHIPV
jgi:hypothetical protein